MGLLDNKSRIIDVIVTTEGRRQLASGDLRIKFASFSDSSTFYEEDIISGSANATNRIYLEASNLPQDQIVFESDDSGKLVPFSVNSPYSLQSGQLISYSTNVATSSFISGSSDNISTLSGNTFASEIEGILTGSFDNFSKNQIIGSYDALFEDDGFSAGPLNLTFSLTNDRPISASDSYTSNINHLESLFNDPKLANVNNFKYLPPINLRDKSVNNNVDVIGNYSPWGSVSLAFNQKDAYSVLRNELSYFEKIGFCKTVLFDPTSKENMLIGQMFEITDKSVTKLDVIYHGKFSGNNAETPSSDIFFVGKIKVDDNETQSFIHLFTLIFE